MSAISDHKRNLNQAKDDLNRMIQEVNGLLDSPEPDHQRLAKLFDRMEHSCRSGFNNAFDSAEGYPGNTRLTPSGPPPLLRSAPAAGQHIQPSGPQNSAQKGGTP